MRIVFLLAAISFPSLMWLSQSGCKDTGTDTGDDIVFPDSNVSYLAHVQPYMTLRCSTYGCHDDATQAGGLSLTTYMNMTARPGIVVPRDSKSSLLMQRIDGRLPHPPNAPILINQNQLNGIRRWIDEGAKYN
jgi:hypothetical protein